MERLSRRLIIFCGMVKRIPVRQNIQKQGITPVVDYRRMIGEKDHLCMMEMEIARILVYSHFYHSQLFHLLSHIYTWYVHYQLEGVFSIKIKDNVISTRKNYVIQLR